MALKKGIWDPKLRGTNIKRTNVKSLIVEIEDLVFRGYGLRVYG